MNYAILLAGGSGTRMGNTNVPKQFLPIKNKPVIIYSIENVLKCSDVDRVVIVCNKDYVDYLIEIVSSYNLQDKVDIALGGKNRLESAINGVKHIVDEYGLNDDDIIMAHDSVRIFTSQRILSENIEQAKKYGAATTVFMLEETVLCANDDGMLYKSYPRENRYTGQSPQTFNAKKFLELVEKTPEEKKQVFTDLAEVFYENNEVVFPVIGEKRNIKLTTPFDMVLAKMQIDEK